MPKLDPSLVEAARQAPIEAVAVSLGLTLKATGHELHGPCPLCGQGRDRFIVWPGANRWWCRRCNESGDGIGLVMAITRVGFRAAVEQLASAPLLPVSTPPLPVVERPAPLTLTPELAYLLRRAAALYEARLWELGDRRGSPLRYLRRARGWSDATLRRARLGYCGTAPELVRWIQAVGFPIQIAREVRLLDETRQDREHLMGRIVFSALLSDGQVVHLSGRRFAFRGGPKYKDLTGLPPPLYGLDCLVASASTPVLVTESQPDRVTLLEWGYEALSTGGTGMTVEQAHVLRALGRPLLFVGQNDEASRVAIQRAVALTGRGRILFPDEGHKDVANQHLAGPSGKARFDDAYQALIRKERKDGSRSELGSHSGR